MSTVTQTTDRPRLAVPPEGLSEFTDAELLDAWTRDRHGEALATLIERYSQMVLSVCRRRCRSSADADDAFQTTFLYLSQNSRSIRRPECLPGWLHRVAQRAASATLVDHHSSSDSMSEPPSNEQDPLEEISRRHEAISLDEEIAALPDQYRTAIVMHLYDGCSLQRIAEHMQTSLGAIRGRLQRGKRLLANRLRRRGIVPILAFAAAGATMVSSNEAASASEPLVDSLSTDTLPDPPVDTHLLEKLLSNGTRIMNPIHAIGGLLASGVLVALSVIPGTGGDGTGDRQVITLQAESPPLVAQVAPADPGESGGTEGSGGGVAQPQSAAPTTERTVWETQYRPAVAQGALAEQIRAVLDMETEITLSSSVETLAEDLQAQIAVPVILDERAAAFAKLDPSQAVTHVPQNEPVRTALRKILSPMGLKVNVEEEALVITADHEVLVHRNIGTSRWLNVKDELMKQYKSALDKPVSFEFIQTPLRDAVTQYSGTVGIPIVIDTRALEEIGLDSDAPVSSFRTQSKLEELSAGDSLYFLLRDLDLTLNVVNNIVTVTTREAAETQLLTRIYFLEGLNVSGDFDSLIQLIQTSVKPDCWEALGGNGTMAPIVAGRPALVVSTVLDAHDQIEAFIDAYRENSFLLDAKPVPVEIPASSINPGTNPFGGGGFGNGGFGGMGGGGGLGGGMGGGGGGGGGFF